MCMCFHNRISYHKRSSREWSQGRWGTSLRKIKCSHHTCMSSCGYSSTSLKKYRKCISFHSGQQVQMCKKCKCFDQSKFHNIWDCCCKARTFVCHQPVETKYSHLCRQGTDFYHIRHSFCPYHIMRTDHSAVWNPQHIQCISLQHCNSHSRKKRRAHSGRLSIHILFSKSCKWGNRCHSLHNMSQSNTHKCYLYSPYEIRTSSEELTCMQVREWEWSSKLWGN